MFDQKNDFENRVIYPRTSIDGDPFNSDPVSLEQFDSAVFLLTGESPDELHTVAGTAWLERLLADQQTWVVVPNSSKTLDADVEEDVVLATWEVPYLDYPTMRVAVEPIADPVDYIVEVIAKAERIGTLAEAKNSFRFSDVFAVAVDSEPNTVQSNQISLEDADTAVITAVIAENGDGAEQAGSAKLRRLRADGVSWVDVPETQKELEGGDETLTWNLANIDYAAYAVAVESSGDGFDLSVECVAKTLKLNAV